MELRDIRWVTGRFGLTYGMVRTHRVATVEYNPSRTGPAYSVHLAGTPIIGVKTTKLPAHTLEEAKLVASQKIVQHINHFIEEIQRYATTDDEASAA